MKPLEMHREARAEMLDAADWYEQQRRGLGGEFNDAVEAVLDQIKAAPQRGWRYGGKGHRVLPTMKFPYFVFYLEEDERIWIPAIAHQKRKPDYWQHRQ